MKAILFDFWGTLVEAGVSSVLHESYKMIRPRMPYSPFVVQFEEIYMTKVFPDQATGFKEIISALNPRCPQFVVDKLVGLWNKNKLLAHPYPETVEVLKSLKEKGLKLVLVTNAPTDNIEPVLEKFELGQYFDHIHISAKAGMLKQNPATFEHVSKTLNVDKKDMLMVGDSLETDIEGATAAGVKAVLIDRRNKREYKDKIADLKELDKFL